MGRDVSERNLDGISLADRVRMAGALSNSPTLDAVSVTSVELGDLGGLADGQMRAFADVGPNGIVVCRVAGQLHAVEDNCSHRNTPLSEGRLRGFLLTCPLHGAQFDVRNGAHQGPPAFEPVACFAVTEHEGSALVHLPG